MSTDSSWSIDQLAALTGLPTRTVRGYRTMGLIDPPRMQGRVGRYDELHRARLELISRLQDRGYSLAAIRDLCAAAAKGRSLEEVLGSPGSAIDEPATAFTTDALVRAVPAFVDDGLRAAAVDVGLLHTDGRDEWVARAPALLALVGDAIAAGAAPTAAIQMAAGLIDGARRQSKAVADLVVGELWDENDQSPSELVSIARLARLRLCQSVASLVVDESGKELRKRAMLPGGRGLDGFVDELQVGVVFDPGGERERAR